MNKAIFLDRDGTINVDYGYVHDIDKLDFLPGVLEGMKMFQDAGYILVIITNQSGLARGMFTNKEYEAFTECMLKRMEEKGIYVKKIYTCPHLENAIIPRYRKKCNCRKPALELFYQAITELEIDVQQSIAIGDRERDVEICNVENIKGFVVYQDEVVTTKNNNIQYLPGGVLDVAKKVLGKIG